MSFGIYLLPQIHSNKVHLMWHLKHTGFSLQGFQSVWNTCMNFLPKVYHKHTDSIIDSQILFTKDKDYAHLQRTQNTFFFTTFHYVARKLACRPQLHHDHSEEHVNNILWSFFEILNEEETTYTYFQQESVPVQIQRRLDFVQSLMH